MSKAIDLLATYTGDAAQLLAAVIELALSDARFAVIIEAMQADGRQMVTDVERDQIKAWLDADRDAAQKAIDKLP